jgi:hypothetical protein
MEAREWPTPEKVKTIIRLMVGVVISGLFLSGTLFDASIVFTPSPGNGQVVSIAP